MKFALTVYLTALARQAKASEDSRQLSSDDFARGSAIVPYSLPWWHPEIQYVAVNEIPGPSDHPLLDQDPDFQRFINANTDEGHRFLDGRRGYIQRPWGLPRGHPNCDNYFIYQELPVNDLPTVHFDHPDIHDAYLNGERLPEGHPSASGLLQKVLPEGHPDVDDLFLSHEELPSWHPDLSLLLNDNPIESIYVFSGHPDIEDEIGEPVDDHPSIHHLFENHLPDSHPHIDDLLQEGYTLPSWHPDISTIVIPRSMLISPGSVLCFSVAALLIVIGLSLHAKKWRNTKQTNEVVITKDTVGETSSSDHTSESGEDGSIELSEVDHRRHLGMMHREHCNNNLNPNEERILVYKEKKATWKKIFGKRIKKTDHSTGEAIMCLVYVLINVAALWASPTYPFGVGFGSLSVGNTVFTFLTAARNSVLTWFVGASFERVLVYHRAVGRLTILLALIHSGFYYNDILDKTSDPVTLTGIFSLGCGAVIALSSLNYVRRKFFNVFFWSHFSFLGFVIGLYLHASSARPFVVAAMLCYGVDKGLQMMWKWPKRTTVFEKVDDRTVHVQFLKPQLGILSHRVGQYVFVNFPSLSLKEWHPFSVASGPRDQHIDVYIRALGDHTKKIVDYSERCVAEGKQVKIRVDGPYGSLPFNYCRYGSILFVGGGIGITPIISALKDIYDVENTKKRGALHCIKSVSVVWIMPHACEASLFLDLLNRFHLKSLEGPLVPDLKLSIHATRDSDNASILGQQIVCSKPQFIDVMDECIEDMPAGFKSMLVYACGPSGLVNQLWDASSKRNSKGRRVDFYHETFEF